jgi:hypothetical protein
MKLEDLLTELDSLDSDCDVSVGYELERAEPTKNVPLPNAFNKKFYLLIKSGFNKKDKGEKIMIK